MCQSTRSIDHLASRNFVPRDTTWVQIWKWRKTNLKILITYYSLETNFAPTKTSFLNWRRRCSSFLSWFNVRWLLFRLIQALITTFLTLWWRVIKNRNGSTTGTSDNAVVKSLSMIKFYIVFPDILIGVTFRFVQGHDNSNLMSILQKSFVR